MRMVTPVSTRTCCPRRSLRWLRVIEALSLRSTILIGTSLINGSTDEQRPDDSAQQLERTAPAEVEGGHSSQKDRDTGRYTRRGNPGCRYAEAIPSRRSDGNREARCSAPLPCTTMPLR